MKNVYGPHRISSVITVKQNCLCASRIFLQQIEAIATLSGTQNGKRMCTCWGLLQLVWGSLGSHCSQRKSHTCMRLHPRYERCVLRCGTRRSGNCWCMHAPHKSPAYAHRRLLVCSNRVGWFRGRACGSVKAPVERDGGAFGHRPRGARTAHGGRNA